MVLLTFLSTVLVAAILRPQESLAFHQSFRHKNFPTRSYSCVEKSAPQLKDEKSTCSPNDGLATIRQWTEQAIEKRGTTDGLEALEKLGQFCGQRLPYDFDSNKELNVRPTRQLIPSQVTQQVSTVVKDMEAQGLLSTNLDSVDGLPSFHLNLVSNGKPIFEKGTNDPFGQKIEKLLDLVGPIIYKDLLRQARSLARAGRLEVSDIFLRRYGQDRDDARNGISAHYDVFSKVTAVIAMDNVAARGDNGLFTTVMSGRETSNHASLRRYFPLEQGDGVLHSWDVLHGVDVLPGNDRTSLIVWFTEKDSNESESMISPWLTKDKKRIETDQVTQFVLASALASVDGNELESGTDNAAMFHSPSTPLQSNDLSYNSQALYLQSASRGNVFALTRVGSICEANEWSSQRIQEEAKNVLKKLGARERLPAHLQTAEIDDLQRMAWQFWFEGAIRGNPSAQFALADDLMAHSFSISDEDAAQFRLLAAVMFGLSAQQGDEEALERLAKVIELTLSLEGRKSLADMKPPAVFQTAQAAMSK